jgi:hypothetical protein
MHNQSIRSALALAGAILLAGGASALQSVQTLQSAQAAGAGSHQVEATFRVHLPLVGLPPHDPGENWPRPPVWGTAPWPGGEVPLADTIDIPNGRPIYALIVSGYGNNGYLDELMCFKFARHLMSKGAYVHYAWWNNLLKPYMQGPLHHTQSYPGDVFVDGVGVHEKFSTLAKAAKKAYPGEDYQFLADAQRFLAAVRENNPSAIIIVVGHSMGGSSVVHLGSPWHPLVPPVEMPVIDLLAPLDPGNNRNFPFGGPRPALPPFNILSGEYDSTHTPPFYFNPEYINWTRWRGSRSSFAGFKNRDFFCNPVGPWLYDVPPPPYGICGGEAFYDSSAPALVFGKKIVNLFHRYQTEYFAPHDFSQSAHFGHQVPPGGTSSQALVPIKHGGADKGGWPFGINFECCPSVGQGIGWPQDGHGEIVGWRGPITVIPIEAPQPLGVRVVSSPQCGGGSCTPLTWPARSATLSQGVFTWSNALAQQRVSLLRALEELPLLSAWEHQPYNPALCLVSPGLIALFESMNRPPLADAGLDQTVQSGPFGTAGVSLDGSGSTDPEDLSALTYSWSGPFGSAVGIAPVVDLPIGNHWIKLTVTDPPGHISEDNVFVAVN